MEALMPEPQKVNLPLRRGPRRPRRCRLLVSLGTDESASLSLSPDSTPSKYKAGTPIAQEA